MELLIREYEKKNEVLTLRGNVCGFANFIYTFNFITGQATFNGEEIYDYDCFVRNIRTDSEIADISSRANGNIERFVKGRMGIQDISFNTTKDLMKYSEIYFVVLEEADFSEVLPKEIDSKFVKWCKEYRSRFSMRNKGIFDRIQEIGKNSSGNDVKRLSNLFKALPYDTIDILLENEELRKTVFTLVNNSNKSFEMWLDSLIELIRMHMDYEKIDIIKSCDLTKTVNQNYTIIKKLKDAARKETIAENLSQLIPLEELFENDKYTIIVPRNVDDLIKEGQDQHNCVGSYYNDEIESNENLVYFLRLKENPSKSYVTCRYDTSDRETLEFRRAFNEDVSDEDEVAIREIDRIINERILTD